jgi:hypothetical protein
MSADRDAIRLPGPRAAGNLKSMSRIIFAALLGVGFSRLAKGQEVPGRDLLQFPLGALAQPRALAATSAGSLWNPALGAPAGSYRTEATIATLKTPTEQAVSGRILGVSRRINARWVATASFASIGVSDLVRTDTDPQSLGEISYGTIVISGGASTLWRSMQLGAAVRYRSGVADTERLGVVATDIGFVVPRLFDRPIRIAGGTCMLSLFGRKESATWSAAVDGPIFRRDSTVVVRAGYGISATERRGVEHLSFVSAVAGAVDGQVGLARRVAYASYVDAIRVGVGLHYARYRLGIARDDQPSSTGASYQVVLSSSFR